VYKRQVYIQSDTETFIERGREPHRPKYTPRGRRARKETYDDFDEDIDDERASRTHPSARRRDEDAPRWAQSLVQRLDVLDGGSQMGRNQRGGDQPQAVIEPVLDEYGSPIPDPNNPGQWLERKIIYEPAAQGAGVRDPEMMAQLEEQRAIINKMQETLADHETERKISSAINPLIDKITGLEKRDPAAKAGMSDEQFKMTTEKEIFQDISATVENTVTTVIEPILEGVTDMQKMQAMREIIGLEHQDHVAPGTYLKYMAGDGVGSTENITKERVGGTIDMIKTKSKGVM